MAMADRWARGVGFIFFKISKILAGKFPASRIPFPEASGDQT